MSFIRHVGKHGDRKVAVVFREVPGEEHMCLVTYTELLGQQIHDPLIKCIESDIGQQSDSLADALTRSYTTSGAPILQTLHAEGKLKKVNTDLIVMTPAPNTSIKLVELNKILNEMKLGEDAVKKLSDMDQSLGMQSPQEVAKRMRAPKKSEPVLAATGEVLGDAALAQDRLTQALKMEGEARGLLSEAERLKQEAKQLDPTIKLPKAANGSKVRAPVSPTAVAKVRKTRAKVSVG